jgi:uncharacterized protein YceK
MRNFILSLLVAVTLGGCATTYVPTTGGNQQDFAVANYRCQRESQPSGAVAARGSQNFVVAFIGVAALAAGAAAASNYHACMAAAGWVPKS